MKKIITILFCTSWLFSFSQSKHNYSVAKTFHIASGGGWDYIAVHDKKLYVSHGSQVNILDENTGDSISVIPNTTGVHGIAFNESLNKGYTSNGRLNNVTVFDLSTNQVLAQIATGENPDAIMYEPFSKTIITCNGRTNNLSIIGAVKQQVIATVSVGGKPETAVSDEKGMLFVNIEDKNEIAAVDLKSFTVTHYWSLKGAEGPTGLAIDKATRRLFAGCDKKLVIMNADDGSIVQTVAIGDGCDGVAFNNVNKTIYTSNGEGTLSIVEEKDADHYVSAGDVKTKRGARTITIDENANIIFLPTADFDPVAKNANGRPVIIPGSFQVLVVQ